MTLATDTKKHFRTIGHNLNPIVTIAGNGLSEGVLAELDRALEDHELIKIKLAIADREERAQTIADICSQCAAEVVQTIGKVALIFRAAKKPNLKKSNAR